MRRHLVLSLIALGACKGDSHEGVDAAVNDGALADSPAAPIASITSGAETGVAAAMVTFTFTADNPSAAFECGLDGVFEPCPGGTKSFAFASSDHDSVHEFAVRAVTTVTGPSVQRMFTVDALGPVVNITTPAQGEITGPDGTVTFVSDADAVTQACMLDGGTIACASGSVSFSLTNGTHTFSVQGADALGNLGPAASVTWSVDAAPPVVTALSYAQVSTNARISFSLSDASSIAMIFCRIDGGTFVQCGTGTSGFVNYSVSGTHLVEVYAIDEWNNNGLGAISAAPPATFARLQFTAP
jgi:hypothetical protein